MNTFARYYDAGSSTLPITAARLGELVVNKELAQVCRISTQIDLLSRFFQASDNIRDLTSAAIDCLIDRQAIDEAVDEVPQVTNAPTETEIESAFGYKNKLTPEFRRKALVSVGILVRWAYPNFSIG